LREHDQRELQADEGPPLLLQCRAEGQQPHPTQETTTIDFPEEVNNIKMVLMTMVTMMVF
jgi:hypothetical protein